MSGGSAGSERSKPGEVEKLPKFVLKGNGSIMNTDIESQLRDFLAKNILFEPQYTLPNDSSFLAQGIIDSLGFVELVDFIRRQFGFEVPMRDIVPANFDSISRLADYIRRRLKEEESGKQNVLLGTALSLQAERSAVRPD